MSIPKTTLPEVPAGVTPAMKRFLTAVRNNVHSLNAGMVPPQQVSNLTAVPIAGGNKIRFTRGDGDFYVLRWSATPNIDQAQSVDLGVTNEYDDVIGQGAVKRYYWVVSKKNGTRDSQPAGPVNSTSLAPGTATTVPAAPAAAAILTTDQSTGATIPVSYQGGKPTENP